MTEFKSSQRDSDPSAKPTPLGGSYFDNCPTTQASIRLSPPDQSNLTPSAGRPETTARVAFELVVCPKALLTVVAYAPVCEKLTLVSTSEAVVARIVIETQGQSLTAAQLSNVVLQSSSGRSIRLGDVGTVQEGIEPKIGDATIMGRSGVLLLISSQFGSNTLEVTRNLDKALDDLKPGITAAGITLYPDLFRPANFADLRNERPQLFLRTEAT